ncbi:MAG TPA: diaminopimelate decarboxylase, partial [Blastocatellia bacterium]|nr:diaminopimelate decarboxylase [Blastocatellia bacterium]
MIYKLSDERISTVFRRFQSKGPIGRDDTSIIFYDLSYLDQRIQDLMELFPPSTLHAIAIKANPLQRTLERMKVLGTGLEAATLPEIHIAQNAGFPAAQIVFDSPAKTMEELEYALALGVHVNADSISELERIESLVRDHPPRGTIGVRINPQVGTGTILSTSVAGDFSKFGVPLNDERDALLDKFLRYN